MEPESVSAYLCLGSACGPVFRRKPRHLFQKRRCQG